MGHMDMLPARSNYAAHEHNLSHSSINLYSTRQSLIKTTLQRLNNRLIGDSVATFYFHCAPNNSVYEIYFFACEK